MHTALQARTRIVQSPANRWVKALRAALAHPPALAREPYAQDEAPLLALEGFHLIVEALRSGLAPVAIFLPSGQDADALQTLLRLVPETLQGRVMEDLRATEFLVLPPALFASLLDTESPQPIAALLPAPAVRMADLLTNQVAKSALPGVLGTKTAAPLILVLSALQDPGNVGTLLRSAEAFGATGALLLAGTATPWSSKSLRASAGSALRMPMLSLRYAGEASALLRRNGVRSYAAVPAGGKVVEESNLREAAALWIGNEGAGLSEKDLQACDARVSLSMAGPTESLNAAVAGSLLLYEALRQRQHPTHT